MLTAFHPQTDGQTEQANRTLEEMLRAYVNHKQDNWDECLPALEFAFNNTKNSSTEFTPFFLNTGAEPLTPAALLSPPALTLPSVEGFLQQQSQALVLAQSTIYMYLQCPTTTGTQRKQTPARGQIQCRG
jgi:hypothetical protein